MKNTAYRQSSFFEEKKIFVLVNFLDKGKIILFSPYGNNGGNFLNKGKKQFPSPTMAITSQCHKCRACVRACPVKAIKYEPSYLRVERMACAEHVFKVGECFECISECHTGAINLVLFEINGNEIKRVKQK